MRRGNFLVWRRPGLAEFLRFVFAHFDLAVWTSAARHNAASLVSLVFGEDEPRLKFVYDQSRCEAIATGDKKPLFRKDLAAVWSNFPAYNQTNTILVDDSDAKALRNPSGCHFNPGTWSHQDRNDGGLLPEGVLWRFLETNVGR